MQRSWTGGGNCNLLPLKKKKKKPSRRERNRENFEETTARNNSSKIQRMSVMAIIKTLTI